MSSLVNRVPAEPFVPVILEYLGSQDDVSDRREGQNFDGPMTLLAESLGVHRDTLRYILSGRVATIDFDIVDKIMCITGRIDEWINDQVYLGAELREEKPSFGFSVDKSRVCLRKGCSVRFTSKSKRKKYCSDNCRSSGWRESKGKIKTLPRGKKRSLEALRCRNGHERTRENTRINSAGYRYCVICHRESQKAYDRRRRAA